MALVVVAPACAGNSTPSAATASSATTTIERITLDQQQIVVRGRTTVSSQVDIDAQDSFFAPNVLTAAPGSTITLHVVNHGQALHNISVTEQGINHDLQPNDAFDAIVHVPASGQLIFFCRIHRDETGMVGVINQTAA